MCVYYVLSDPSLPLSSETLVGSSHSSTTTIIQVIPPVNNSTEADKKHHDKNWEEAEVSSC